MVGTCALEDIFASTELSLYVLVHYMTNTMIIYKYAKSSLLDLNLKDVSINYNRR